MSTAVAPAPDATASQVVVLPWSPTAVVLTWSLSAAQLARFPELRLLGDDGVLFTLGLSSARGQWNQRGLRSDQALWAVIVAGSELLACSSRVVLR